MARPDNWDRLCACCGEEHGFVLSSKQQAMHREMFESSRDYQRAQARYHERMARMCRNAVKSEERALKRLQSTGQAAREIGYDYDDDDDE